MSSRVFNGCWFSNKWFGLTAILGIRPSADYHSNQLGAHPDSWT